MNLAVVVPVFNESSSIKATLTALRNQQDWEFFLVLCDNASTDDTVHIVESELAGSGLTYYIVSEPQKGTGAAADTACRRAIELGATHLARTDADCVPRADWTATIKRIFDTTDLRMMAGYTPVRQDEVAVSIARRVILRIAFEAARIFGMVRPSNYGSGLKGKYVMSSGNNLAIESALYLESGGFPRTRIEDLHEDRELVLRVRRVTSAIGYRKDIIVFASSRRVDAWGLWNTLRWYANHGYRPQEVDIRREGAGRGR